MASGHRRPPARPRRRHHAVDPRGAAHGRLRGRRPPPPSPARRSRARSPPASRDELTKSFDGAADVAQQYPQYSQSDHQRGQAVVHPRAGLGVCRRPDRGGRRRGPRLLQVPQGRRGEAASGRLRPAGRRRRPGDVHVRPARSERTAASSLVGTCTACRCANGSFTTPPRPLKARPRPTDPKGCQQAGGVRVSRSDVLVGRQPIFDAKREVQGYELVLRAGGPDGADGSGEPAVPSRRRRRSGDLLTSRVLFSSLQVGVDRFVGDKLMFCDVSEELLAGDIALLLPPERTVLEVPTRALVGADGALSRRRRRVPAARRRGLHARPRRVLVVRGRGRPARALLVRQGRPAPRRRRRRWPRPSSAAGDLDVRVLVQSVDTEGELGESEAAGRATCSRGTCCRRPSPSPGGSWTRASSPRRAWPRRCSSPTPASSRSRRWCVPTPP